MSEEKREQRIHEAAIIRLVKAGDPKVSGKILIDKYRSKYGETAASNLILRLAAMDFNKGGSVSAKKAKSVLEKLKSYTKKKDPKKGTGKKPKGSGRRLYTDENPKDTVGIKYATVQDAKETIAKVMRIKKSYARKIQILTVLEQRAKAANKMEQARLAKKAKQLLKARRDGTSKKSTKS